MEGEVFQDFDFEPEGSIQMPAPHEFENLMGQVREFLGSQPEVAAAMNAVNKEVVEKFWGYLRGEGLRKMIELCKGGHESWLVTIFKDLAEISPENDTGIMRSAESMDHYIQGLREAEREIQERRNEVARRRRSLGGRAGRKLTVWGIDDEDWDY